MKLTTAEAEIELMNYFDFRKNIIVPNVSWGLNLHECDLLIVRKSGYAVEVEIKISVSDLQKDRKKKHQHRSDKIKELYFAVPEDLNSEHCFDLIPKRAGIILINENTWTKKYYCQIVRKPKVNTTARKLTEAEIKKVLHLGCMRIYNFKRKIESIRREADNNERLH